MRAKLLLLLMGALAKLSLPQARRLGRLLGCCAWPLGTRMARVTRRNLALCFPDMDRRRRAELGRKSLRHTFMTALEAVLIWHWPLEKTLSAVHEVEGLEALEAAWSKGQGVVVIAPHLGNWELLGHYLSSCGCGQCHYLYQAPRNPALGSLIYQGRSKGGAKIVATDGKGVAALLKALGKGEIVGILPDQVPPASAGEFVPFFGIESLTMTLICRLLQKTGATAVLAYALRTRTEGKEGFAIRFREPDSKIYAEHIQDSLRAMNASIEAAVQEAPEQYQWEYKRFKRRPAGASPVY